MVLADPDGPGGKAFSALAARVAELLPPLDAQLAAGCTGRLLAALDAAAREVPAT